MIDVKDIFIGCTYLHNENWCGKRTNDLDTKEFSFKWTPSDWYLVGECLLFLDDISGIPLTPEILHSMSFSSTFSSDPQEPPASKIFNIGDLDIYQPSESINKFYVFTDLELKFLHQLQNLYYSLTGTELIYNPK